MWILLSHFWIIFSLSFWPLGQVHGAPALKETSLALPSNLQPFRTVRVSLLQDVSEIAIQSPSPYRVFDSSGRSLMAGKQIVATRVRAHAHGIQIGAQVFRDIPLTVQSQGEGIQIGGHFYRRSLIFWKTPAGKLGVINEIEIEDYLKGVLPREVHPNWSPEALKAQAVAARTFALFEAIYHRNELYVLSDDVSSQVYGGKTSEAPSTDAAIEATRGEVLTYHGKIFPAFFHSTCGGMTTRPEWMWNVRPHPSLREVSCPFCKGSKNYRWTLRLSSREMESLLRRKGHDLSPLQSLKPVERDPSGRFRFFVIEGGGRKEKIPSHDFRLWMDPARFRSTLLDAVEKEGDGYFFKGRGWGHGAGMCQWGAKQLGELGYGYQEILRYYYPEAAVIHLREA